MSVVCPNVGGITQGNVFLLRIQKIKVSKEQCSDSASLSPVLKKTSHEMACYVRTLDGKLAATLNPLTVKVVVVGVDNCYFCVF